MSQIERTGFSGTLSRVWEGVVQLVGQFGQWLATITINRPPGTCAGVPNQPGGYGSNPVNCNDVVVTAFDAGGGLMVYPGRSKPETLVKLQGGIKGFDAASRLETTFPPSTQVRVVAAHFAQPARIEVFAGGAVVGMQMMAPNPGVAQTFMFNGTGIDRSVVTPNGDTIVIELCH